MAKTTVVTKFPYKFSIKGATYITGTFNKQGVTGTLKIKTTRFVKANTISPTNKIEKDDIGSVTMIAAVNEPPQMIKAVTIGTGTLPTGGYVQGGTFYGFCDADYSLGTGGFGAIANPEEHGVKVVTLAAGETSGGGGGSPNIVITCRLAGNTYNDIFRIKFNYKTTAGVHSLNLDRRPYVGGVSPTGDGFTEYSARGTSSTFTEAATYFKLLQNEVRDFAIKPVLMNSISKTSVIVPGGSDGYVAEFDLSTMNLKPTDTITFTSTSSLSDYQGPSITKTAKEWAEIASDTSKAFNYEYTLRLQMLLSLYWLDYATKTNTLVETNIFGDYDVINGYIYINEDMSPKILCTSGNSIAAISNYPPQKVDFVNLSTYGEWNPRWYGGTTGKILEAFYTSASIDKPDMKIRSSEYFGNVMSYGTYTPSWDGYTPINTKSMTRGYKLFDADAYGVSTVTGVNTSNVWNAYGMFHPRDLHTPTNTELLAFDSTKIITAKLMLEKQRTLQLLPYFHTANIMDFTQMLKTCTALTSVPFVVDMSNACAADGMIEGCDHLGVITLSNVPQHITEANIRGSNTTTLVEILNRVDSFPVVEVKFYTTSDSDFDSWGVDSFKVREGTLVPDFGEIPADAGSNYTVSYFWDWFGQIPINFGSDTFTSEHKTVYARFKDKRPKSTCRIVCVDATTGEEIAAEQIHANYAVCWGNEMVPSDNWNAASSEGWIQRFDTPVSDNWHITIGMFTHETNTYNFVTESGIATRVEFDYIPEETLLINEIKVLCLPNAKQGQVLNYTFGLGSEEMKESEVITMNFYGFNDISYDGRPTYGTHESENPPEPPDPLYLHRLEFGTRYETNVPPNALSSSWVEVLAYPYIVQSTNLPIGTLMGIWLSPTTESGSSRRQWKYVNKVALEDLAYGKFSSGDLVSGELYKTEGIDLMRNSPEGTKFMFALVVSLAI